MDGGENSSDARRDACVRIDISLVSLGALAFAQPTGTETFGSK